MTNYIEKLYELAGIPVSEWYLCHPPFTAEKQLELIKWLVCNISHLDIYKNPKDYFLACLFKGGKHKDFSQALAGLVCELWEDLTEQQREEIKRILE